MGIDFSRATQHYQDGSKFVGQVKDDMFHGRGKMTWASGDSYSGLFEYGYMQGVFTYPDGVLYEGRWQHDRPHGEGRVIYPSGEVIDTTFTEGIQDFEEAKHKADEQRKQLRASAETEAGRNPHKAVHLAAAGTLAPPPPPPPPPPPDGRGTGAGELSRIRATAAPLPLPALPPLPPMPPTTSAGRAPPEIPLRALAPPVSANLALGSSGSAFGRPMDASKLPRLPPMAPLAVGPNSRTPPVPPS
eukprot:TRINITY_DN5935_c0_g2_i1.p1 TRINITY_DN5935_c0_g2~~TRINITY_DN5935_c0_g2_i1.p1  ORF type:complete len:245 (+),score=47.81 TRINITY_DN5935_c0_g2_i1:166-900(+)